MTTPQAQQSNLQEFSSINGASVFVAEDLEALHSWEVFAALGHETRFKIFDFIYHAGDRGAKPKEMIIQYGVDSGTLDFHLKRLLSVGLINFKGGCLRGTYCINPGLPLGLTMLFHRPHY
jgi:predicted transcriptional regulator